VEQEMTVSDAGGLNRLKAAAPVGAAALAVVAAIAAGSLLSSSPTSPLPADSPPQAPVASTANPTAPPPGGAIPGVAFDQAPGGATQVGMEIVVKFKDDGKIKDIVDAFWKDQASARTRFNAFKAGRPEFANLKLDRVTYSGELVLVHDGGAPPDQRLAAMRTIAAKLKNVGDISYAEPNMTAHPGGQ
jgi:hypothetical protein